MASQLPPVLEPVYGGAPRSRGHRPILPVAVANTMRDGARASVGTVLLGLIAASWLSLASWSVQDPSLSHTTALPARNWLEMPGAIGSDLLLQTFGVAALIVLLAPMFWGIALVQREPVPRFGRRLGAYVTAIPALAAAASAWPAPGMWPLAHGLGGIIGDAAFRVVQAPFHAAHAGFGPLAAGVILLMLGLWSSVHSLGLNRAQGRLDGKTRLPSRRKSLRPPSPGPERVEPVLTARGHAIASDPRQLDRFGPYAAFEAAIDDEPIDAEFEARTEAASNGIAARFAPNPQANEPNAPRAMQDTLVDVFTGGRRAARTQSAGPEILPDGDHYGQDVPGYEVLPSAIAPATQGSRALVKSKAYKRPSLNLLQRSGGGRGKPGYTASMLRGNARLLEDVLADFGVIGEIRDIVPGPVVTIYELEAARGTNPARVISLADDIARGMGVPALRIACVPGRSVLGIEMPNQVREAITLRDVLDADVYRATMDTLPVALGRTVSGTPIVADLARIPHLLVAGANGSGKSTGINAMILSLLYKHGPEDCRFLMIDPKMLDLAAYNGIPHLLTPVVTDPHKAITALAWCVSEMEERYKRMAALGVRNIDVFNNRVRNAKKRGERLARTVQTGFDNRTGEATYEQEDMNLEPMPYIVIVMDEFADLMAVAGADIEGAVQRLAVAAKAAGIHLIMATERPTADIATPALKSHLAARVSYKTANKPDSRAVIGSDDAEQLLGHGDMLYANGAGHVQRVHGPYVSGEEIESVASSLRQQGEARYVEGIVGDGADLATVRTRRDTPDPVTARVTVSAVSEDALYDRAVAIIIRDRSASLLNLQRRLNVSPSWAATLMQRLQADGIISPPDTRGQHQVLVEAAA